MKKIVITGQRGDIGSILYQLFQDNENYEIIPYNGETVTEISQFIHLAAKHPTHSSNEIIGSNIKFLQEIIAYSERNKVEEFIFFSSTSVYGKPNKEILTEDEPFNNPDIYGLSKGMGEKLLEDSHLKAISLRLPGILGMKSYNLLSKLYDKLLKNEEITITNPYKLFNNFIYPKNIYDFICKIKLIHKFDIVNLAVERQFSLLEIVEILKGILNSTSHINISREKQPFHSLSIEKAKIVYNFKPFDIKPMLATRE